jgi:alpha-1,3-glucosyltransferase
MPAVSPAHKPRRKANKGDIDKLRAPAFPLAAFLWPARTSLSQWEVLPLVLMVVGLFRWAAGLWGYSGEQIRSDRARCLCGMTD